MASKKDLKKDIDYLTYEVISDCFTAMTANPGKKADELAKIVSDAVIMRNELFARAGHPDAKKDPAKVKGYYRKLRIDLLEGSDKLFDRISKVVKG